MFLFTASSKIVSRTYAEALLNPMALATLTHIRQTQQITKAHTPLHPIYSLFDVSGVCVLYRVQGKTFQVK